MTSGNMPPADGEGNGALVPAVFERDGRVFANSRDVAAFFGKRHDNVLRDIRSALAETGQWGLLNFEETQYVDAQNGRTYKAFSMTKNGFTYLVQGYTGPKAAGFKIAYIDRFDAMESALKGRAAALPDLSDPLVLQHLLADHLSKRIEAERRAVQAEKAAAETVEAYDRIAKADGSLCLTDAAKDLQVRPKDLFSFARQNHWIYTRPGKGGDIAYQDKIQAGYLEHKVTTITRTDGTEKVVEQVRVTPKGLAKLAMIVPGARGANGHHSAA